MVHFHLEQNADVTVAALAMPLEQCSTLGVVRPEHTGWIAEFQEKPAHPRPMAGDPRRALASMGNYIFSTDVLIGTLKAIRLRSEQDFGRDVLRG